MPVFANRDTSEAVRAKLDIQVRWQVFQKWNGVPLPHGTRNGTFSHRHAVTDIGYVPECVKQHIRGVQTLVIEANYDEDLLERDERRPWSTKQRIRGRHWHLTNHAAVELVEEFTTYETLEKVYLAHLSKDCNRIDTFRNKFACLEPQL